MKNIEQIFSGIGGEFLTSPKDMTKKLKKIKAYIFDWDGVFNNGEKVESGSSVFSEVDSMGTNLLRFSHWLEHGKLPFTAVISGERNSAAFWLCNREHYTSNYYKIAHKVDALDHFCKKHSLEHDEVAFVFDDALDLSIAHVCGLRILVKRNATPLFTGFVRDNKLADYVTGAESGHFALREASELLMGLRGNFDESVSKRSAYGNVYREYADARNKVVTSFYAKSDKGIVEQAPK